MLAHTRAAPVVAQLADMSLEVIQEQVCTGQSPGNGLAEVYAKIRTLEHASQSGMKQHIPEDHDVLVLLVQHAPATANWFRHKHFV